MKNLSILLIAVLFFACNSKSKKVSEWRGENRSGIYNETNLLKEWPAEGPELLWAIDSIGNGYGSPVICENTMYLNGEIDSLAYLISLDLQGNILWKTEFGTDWMENFIGSRSAPTVVDDLVYVASGMGGISCIHAESGELKWKVNMLEKYEDLLKTSKDLEAERETYPLAEDQDYLALHSNLPDDLIERSKDNIMQLTACKEDVRRKIEEICDEDFNKMMREHVESREMLL